MPHLKRNTPRLLKVVGGKKHATADDHEEDGRGQESKINEMTDEQINADPISSDEEGAPAPSPPPPSKPLKAPTSAKRPRTTSSKPAATESRKRKKAKTCSFKPPKPGSYERGREEKAERYGDAEKENTYKPTSSADKDDDDEPFGDRMELTGPRRAKAQPMATNIHAPSRKTYGQNITCGGKKAGRGKNLYADSWSAKTKPDEDDSSQSQPPPEAPTHATELNSFEKFIAGAHPVSGSENPDVDTDVPTSSGVDQAALHDLRHNLEADVATLPFEDRDSICALCHAPVDPDQSALFYRDRKRTVKNQTLFCKEHRRATAQAEYEALGLPPIDWERLPERIRGFRPQLRALLRNETDVESVYREHHAAKLLSGKAAALPSKRKDKKMEELEQDMFATIDNADESTGFYGHRGKRVMMEVVGEVLVDDIGEVQATDPVVGRSGFAAFLQAVLVPELTVLLAMQDLGGVSEGVAKEKIAKSGELGVLLYEDVDDEVAWGSDDELSDSDE